MTDEVLENYVRQYIESQDAPEIAFAWQGGEPTLMGLAFFERAVEFQKRYCPPHKKVTNAMQTNGVLLDDTWCEFLHRNGFLIGLSIDGPRELHDHYRVDKGGHPTFDKVMRGLELLKKHRVEFNTLTVVNRQNSQHPLEVYRFLKKHGSDFMQFIPLVERVGAGTMFAAPPHLNGSEPPSPVTPWSVRAEDYGAFLCAIWDEWVRRDVGTVFVQLFDVQLGIWLDMPSSLCVFAETCGRAVIMEHNGDIYSCDHYVYPEYKVGNVLETPLNQILDSPAQTKFGADKRDALPRYCRECDVRFACNGECPKHRFIRTPDGEAGLNYLCAGYKRFFNHIDSQMRLMADLIRANRPAADIMPMLAERDASERKTATQPTAQRNDPCPCGSGKKFKKCCGEKKGALR
jgi:uncharacterized protein